MELEIKLRKSESAKEMRSGSVDCHPSRCEGSGRAAPCVAYFATQ